ncbi:MAG: WecB/TagA/CpsF family glycosyltransferase [Desulfobacterales bacterium]|nr:WecB/TagA/CpsF family glycosyltransferase [Desulfobacterales bacterium]MBF0395584.1 WecB/TagA/CpsF family glycosyltransferase [Desulfobacterales bacterium]
MKQYNSYNEMFSVFGIPIDNINMDEAVKIIFSMIDEYSIDKKPRLIATVNIDFLVNTLSWFSGIPNHPELLSILRRADIVTADGMPIVWLSKLIGSPIKERVTGSDLVPMIAKEAEIKGKSIYFLGGREGVGLKAAEILKGKYPELKIAGYSSPFVNIHGEALNSAIEDDIPIVSHINKSNPDILLVAFGNPKQEMWFRRNNDRLNVAVTIGIGGTFEFITGGVARAPKWMQKLGLEWVFRISQDPKRLWKRYLLGFFKFPIMIFPIIFYHYYRKWIFNSFNKKKIKNIELNYQVGDGTIHILTLPDYVDGKNYLSDEYLKSSNIIIDFSNTRFIEASGIGFLLKIWKYALKNGKRIYVCSIKKSVLRILKINRVFDIFSDIICQDINGAIVKLKENESLPLFFYYLVNEANYTLISLFGELDSSQVSKISASKIFNSQNKQNYLFDLSNLKFVDSTGLIFFLKFRTLINESGGKLVLFGINKTIENMFKVTKVDKILNIVKEFSDAERSLS